MTRRAWAWGALLLLGGMAAFPGAAGALSVEQVLALKKAGVGEKTIQALIEAENAASARGASGVYTLRPFAGREWIVYEASSPAGVQEYPLDLDPSSADLTRVGRVLGAGASASPVPASRPAARVSPGGSGAGYALLLASHAARAEAEAQVRALVAGGLLARLMPVDEPGQGRRFLVLAGSYPDQSEAQAQGARLRREGRIGDFQIIGQ